MTRNPVCFKRDAIIGRWISQKQYKSETITTQY